jgi:hypothetical protein
MIRTALMVSRRCAERAQPRRHRQPERAHRIRPSDHALGRGAKDATEESMIELPDGLVRGPGNP